MLKNISNLGKTLKVSELKTITGGQSANDAACWICGYHEAQCPSHCNYTPRWKFHL